MDQLQREVGVEADKENLCGMNAPQGEALVKAGDQEDVVPNGWFRDHSGKLRPVKGEALTFDFVGDADQNTLAGAPNLQANFSAFRKEKLKAAKDKAAREKDASARRRDPEAMAELRDKFIEQCKKYYGVPYAKRYHEPDSPHYNSPIFLDCCGLVRQVLRDLKDDFGFSPGPWNQAYQFDTCPIRYDTWDKMKPGDLIFAEGKYIKEGVKPQKGDIVHIEVFLGTGPEGKGCCGARWGKGVIQEFESFDFVAKNWKLVKWHFASLDTWLEGTCKSFHPEREWKRKEWVPGSRSVFNVDGDEEDEVAEGDDCEGDAGDAAQEEGVDAGGSEGASKAQNLGKSSRSKPAPDTKTFYVTKGNNDALVTDTLEGMGWTRIPFEDKGRLDYGLKWTELRSDVDFTRFEGKRQLANHIPNTQAFTSKLQLMKSLRDRQRQRRRALKQGALQGADEALAMDSFFPKTFTLSLGSDKIELLQTLQAAVRGDDEAKDSVWIVKPSSSNCGRGIFVTRDHSMIIRDYLQYRTSKQSPVDVASQQDKAENSQSNVDDASKQEAEKPTEDCRGNAEDRTEHKKVETQGMEEGCVAGPNGGGEDGYFETNTHGDKVIIQKYVTNPLLIGGRKFDIRCYFVVASTQPFLVLFRPGYVRRSLAQYSHDDFEDRCAHLTNNAVQKKHADYERMKEESIWSMDQLQEYLCSEGKAPQGYVSDVLTPRMRAVIGEVFESARSKVQRRRGLFELFGADFLVDENLQCWLLEVNTNPALFTNCKVLRDVIPPLINDTLKVAIAAWEQTKDSKDIDASSLPGIDKFDMVYNECAQTQ